MPTNKLKKFVLKLFFISIETTILEFRKSDKAFPYVHFAFIFSINISKQFPSGLDFNNMVEIINLLIALHTVQAVSEQGSGCHALHCAEQCCMGLTRISQIYRAMVPLV